MVSIKTLSLLPLAGLLLMAGLSTSHMAYAEDAAQPSDKIPADVMRGEFRERMGEKLKAMSPEDRKAFIEKMQARRKEMQRKFASMTPEQRAKMKEMREKIAKMTPEERFAFKEKKEDRHEKREEPSDSRHDAAGAIGTMRPAKH